MCFLAIVDIVNEYLEIMKFRLYQVEIGSCLSRNFICFQFIGACKEPVMVIVTELLLGGTLRKYLLNMRPKCLDMRVAIGFALDVARAMECLHSHGIIHRDLKPGMTITFLGVLMRMSSIL